MTDIAATTEAQVVDAVNGARDWKSPLNIAGNRTKRAFGRPVGSWGTVLDVSRIEGIVDYKPEELIITAKPGTQIAEIVAVLAKKNQRLGFEPPDIGPLFDAPAGIGTIGGAISCDLNGAAAVRYGRVRDHLLGIRAVNGHGEVFKAGGKVVKNVTGFDIPKLFCGAFGTLSVLTEVTLRVFPMPEISVVYAIGGIELGAGLTLLKKVWNSPLEATGLSLLSEEAWRFFPQILRSEEEEMRYNNDAQEEYGPINDCAALIRLEGSPASIAHKRSLLNELAGKHRPVEVEQGQYCFDTVGSGTAFSGTLEDVWLFNLPPSACEGIATRLNSAWVADWAGGRLWKRGTPGYDGTWHRAEAEKQGGTATLVRASEETRNRVSPFPPLSPDRLALTRAVKAAFDPLGLFNPGRMVEGL